MDGFLTVIDFETNAKVNGRATEIDLVALNEKFQICEDDAIVILNALLDLRRTS